MNTNDNGSESSRGNPAKSFVHPDHFVIIPPLLHHLANAHLVAEDEGTSSFALI